MIKKIYYILFAFALLSQENIKPMNSSLILGGGCFWCLEAMFEEIDGVIKVESGYAGGQTKNPTYKEVCSGSTGHAEVIRIDYDTSIISYKKLIDMFWKAHDPTTKNRQGADIGTQYRSIILYSNEQEKVLALNSMEEAKKLFNNKIETEISPLDKFYKAEQSHQDYYRLNPSAPYCIYNIQPKLNKFRKNHSK